MVTVALSKEGMLSINEFVSKIIKHDIVSELSQGSKIEDLHFPEGFRKRSSSSTAVLGIDPKNIRQSTVDLSSTSQWFDFKPHLSFLTDYLRPSSEIPEVRPQQ
ncbi:hypothetical protein NPIL_303611 [Nephila pilipes]|uniref:Uncharacterized protein n=1 Tax=Nephila pilipes TaxID=299642 RepID=A0A8X6QGT4_NEPPI|nr:hypothetical protein NPIL_303611 [Nephila pilipes]